MNGELAKAYHAFKLSIPLQESLRYLATMLPAMNPQDRAVFFASLDGAPDAVVSAVRELVVSRLGPEAWPQSVATARN